VVEAGTLRFLIGNRLNNVYDLGPAIFLLKFSLEESKNYVLVESGKRIHSTKFLREPSNKQTQFCMKVCIFIYYIYI
jgi:predicted ribosome quality control (RQC) complex YloA/Tae2 family protein